MNISKMNIDLLKNPIIVGLLAGICTYIYMKWQNDKKYKKNDKHKKEVSLMIPIIVAMIMAFAMWSFFSQNSNGDELRQGQQQLPNNDLGSFDRNAGKMSSLSGSSDASKSIHLIGKGLQIPNEIPDIFLDMEAFD
jgi:hypothetical protein